MGEGAQSYLLSCITRGEKSRVSIKSSLEMPDVNQIDTFSTSPSTCIDHLRLHDKD